MIILRVFEIANQLLICDSLYFAQFLKLMKLCLCQKYFDMASNNTLANNDEKLFSERFLSFIDDDVEKLLEAGENKNTHRKTENDVAFLNLQ